MIAQDTGSAIVGAARADLFLGSGDAVGRRAGLGAAWRRPRRPVAQRRSRVTRRRVLTAGEIEVWRAVADSVTQRMPGAFVPVRPEPARLDAPRLEVARRARPCPAPPAGTTGRADRA